MPPRKKTPRPAPGRLCALAVLAAALCCALLAPAAAHAQEDLDALLKRLPGESPFGRYKVIELIGDLGTQEAIRALVAFFPDEELRWMAVRQVSQLRDAAIPALLEALRAPDADTVRFAAYSLGEIRAAQAVPALVPLLASPDAEIRQHVAYALGMIRDKAATDALIGALKDPDPVVRGYAATALGEIGDQRAKEALLAALRTEDASVVNMATSLFNLGSAEVVEILIGKLRDPNPDNRLYAIYALGKISDPEMVRPLIDVLDSEEIGWLAAKVLVNVGQPALRPLLESLFSEDRTVRLYATYALGRDRRPQGRPRGAAAAPGPGPSRPGHRRRSVDRHRRALGDPRRHPAAEKPPDARAPAGARRARGAGRPLARRDHHLADQRPGPRGRQERHHRARQHPGRHLVRAGGAAARLARRGSPGLPARGVPEHGRPGRGLPVGGARDHQRRTARRAPSTCSANSRRPSAVEAIIQRLHDPDPAVRRFAAIALTEIGDPRAEEFLVALLRDKDPALRTYAAVGLMSIGGRISIRLLLASLNDPETRWLAVRILDKIGGRDIDSLIAALKDERTGWYAEEALTRLDGNVLPELDERLKGPDPAIRESVARVMGEVKDRRAVAPLLEAIQSAGDTGKNSATALIQIADPASVAPLIELLGNQDEEVRLYAAYALGGLKDRRAVPALTRTLADPSSSVRGIAAHALGQIGSRDATEALIKALEDPSAHVRATAAYALARIGDRTAVPVLEAQLRKDPDFTSRKAAQNALDALRRSGR